jgi:hypothetical protein
MGDILILILVTAVGGLAGWAITPYVIWPFSSRLAKIYLCRRGWHSRNYDLSSHDGCSQHARCKWCGYEGMIDSQGNLF